MNIAEANSLGRLLQSLETGASERTREEGITAAEFLAKRARVALNAGPVAPQVAAFVADVHTAIDTAAADDMGLVVELPTRPVEVAQPVGGVL